MRTLDAIARREARVELAQRFIRLAAQHNVLSVLEPVARVGQADDEDAAILEAARELSPLRPSLYKAQVPLRGKERLTELVDREATPWRGV